MRKGGVDWTWDSWTCRGVSTYIGPNMRLSMFRCGVTNVEAPASCFQMHPLGIKPRTTAGQENDVTTRPSGINRDRGWIRYSGTLFLTFLKWNFNALICSTSTSVKKYIWQHEWEPLLAIEETFSNLLLKGQSHEIGEGFWWLKWIEQTFLMLPEMVHF